MLAAAVFDFGPGVISVVTVIAGVVTLYLQSRKANKELKPNGGASMRDAIDRIEGNQTHLASEFAEVKENQAQIVDEVAGIKDRIGNLEHPTPPTP